VTRDPREGPLPFEDLFREHLAAGRRRLSAALDGAAAGLLSAAAWRDLEQGLVRRLTELSGQALIEAFNDFRGGPPAPFRVRLAASGVRSGTSRYRAFVGEMLAGDAFAARWPGLARLVGDTVERWSRNSAEMIARLSDPDLPFQEPVARLRTGLSDPHDGGRTVHAFVFAGGGELVYKPRGLGLETDFARLLAWCGERGLSLDLASPWVLDRGTHGWAALVTPAPCADEGAARRFHRRAGMLLGVLHAFGARDCHCENLVARGEHPVLVDLEAWLPVRWRKWLAGEGLGEAWYRAARQLERSVLATGLLPQWQEGPRRGELRNVGGLGGGRPGRRRRKAWRNVNTDLMVFAWGDEEEGAGANVPTLDGRPLEPAAYRDEVVAGFAEMYGLLLRHRESLLSPAGPLRDVAGRRVRAVLRSTAAYRRLLERSLSPAACRDEAARAAVLEALEGIYREGEGRAARPLLAAERRALEAGDVPFFTASAGETRVEVPGGGAVEGLLTVASLEAARRNLAELSSSDLRAQTALIRAALAATAAALPDDPPEAPRAAAPLPDRDRLLEAALAIGAGLRERAVAGPDGSVAWIGPRAFTSGGLYALSVLGADLYGGTAGIVLFLAALHRATGDPGARDLALRAIGPLRRRLAGGSPRRPELGIGGLTGLPSVLYGLLWAGELLGEPALAGEARESAIRLDPERIETAGELDVVSGCAGALLALLALAGPPPGDGRLLELAGRCAGRLLDRRTAGPGGARGGPAEGWPPPAGFAHGTAGIGYALLRLHARTGAPELLAAAREAIAGGRRPGSSGRRDPRHPGTAPHATWCHGAPGIALARLGTLDVLDDPETRAEIGAALDATRSHPLTPHDPPCCGNLGRAEVLLYAARRLAEPALREEALGIAGRVLQRAAGAGGFGCAPGAGADLADPSFFRGEAGIGFTLLRLAGPGELPCPLLLEGPPGTGPAEISEELQAAGPERGVRCYTQPRIDLRGDLP
jgi:type 2 lantibiotic biosynthesis protein LanM